MPKVRGFEATEIIGIGLVNCVACEACNLLIWYNGVVDPICPRCNEFVLSTALLGKEALSFISAGMEAALATLASRVMSARPGVSSACEVLRTNPDPDPTPFQRKTQRQYLIVYALFRWNGEDRDIVAEVSITRDVIGYQIAAGISEDTSGAYILDLPPKRGVLPDTLLLETLVVADILADRHADVIAALDALKAHPKLALPFQTTPEQVTEIAAIQDAMQAYGLDTAFLEDAADMARTDQGVFDLMSMWMDCERDVDRDDIVEEIRQSISDYDATA